MLSGSAGSAAWAAVLETIDGKAVQARGDTQALELWVGPLGPSTLHVVTFRGTEALSELFEYEVTFATSIEHEGAAESVVAPSDLAQLMVGQAALFIVRATGGTPQVVQGILTRLERLGPVGKAGRRAFHGYRVTLVPRLSLAGLRINTRVFNDTTVKAIVDEVLSEHGIVTSWPEGAASPGRELCIQYRESDLAFVTRLLAEIGHFYYFEPAPAALTEALSNAGALSAGALGVAESMVLCGRAESYPPIHHEHVLTALNAALGDPESAAAEAFRTLTAPVLSFRPDSGMAGAHHHVRELRIHRALTSESVLVRDYDPMHPLHALVARAEAPRRPTPDDAHAVALGELPRLEVYQPYGEYLVPEVGGTDARIHLEQVRAKARFAEGISHCETLSPGRRFRMEDHPDPLFNVEYVITRVTHSGRSPEWSTAIAANEPLAVYENTFQCVPATVPFRPERPTPRVWTSVETATVVGPAEHEIHTDQLGRVKIQFHWDRLGQQNERSSCWIRVMQAWAGAGWGHQFLPRVGMEVAVAFLTGDPDKPVVLGSLYNGIHPPPFAVPGNATRSGIRTQSSPHSDGFNELSFEDAAGDEEVFLHAQRDLREQIKRHHHTHVAGDRRVEVRGDSLEAIHGDMEASVGGEYRMTVQGESRAQIQGGASTAVQGDRSAQIGGREQLRVVRTADVEVHEDLTLRAHGCATLIVGNADAKRSFVLHTDGPITVDGSGSVGIVSAEEVVVQCGRSSIRVCDDGIYLTGPVVRLQSEGADLAMASDLQARSTQGVGIGGRSLTLQSESGGTVHLSSEVSIDGSQILLNSPAQSLEPVEQEDPEPPTVVALTNHEGEPMAGQRFVLTHDDGTQTGGVTNASGQAFLRLNEPADIHFPDLGVADDLGQATGERRAHVVRQGEHLAQLAQRYGFEPEDVWQDEENSRLRSQRDNQQVLNPGDIVIFPGREPVKQSLRLRDSNSFTARVRMLETRIRFFDGDGPWASRTCVVEGLGEPREETTDGDGWLRIIAPATLQSLTVRFPDVDASYRVTLGDVDPISEARGVQMRLSLLGYLLAAPSCNWTEAARAALRAFQVANNIQPSGEPDDDTRRALVSEFGS